MVHEDGYGGLNTGTYDKNKVLDVKPLRCLAPLFPNNVNPQSSTPSSSPFVAASPVGGSVPPGYTPFYPFSTTPPPPQQQSQQTPVGDGPSNYANKKMKIDSVSEESEDSMSGSRADSVRDDGASNGVKKRSWQRKARRSDVVKGKAPADGDSESVAEIRMRYDGLRRRISQLEEISGGMKRSDMKAGSVMMDKGMRTNTRKRTGSVPGVDVGDIFFFRFEMCLVGLHTPTISGIDYMNVKFEMEEETLAVSIVSSGGYEDATDDKDMLIYSGQGGVSKKGVADQKLERGNLALERSLRRGNEVRVIRGMKDLMSPSSKVYFYDGLYKIHESWTEKAKSGCNVFKYKLLRIPGQPEAFGIWKSVQQWRNNINTRPGLILPDLTSSEEKLPVSLVNDIDGDKGPTHFSYSTRLKYSKPLSSLKPSSGCSCHGSCQPGDSNCACIVKNGGYLPHTLNGVLVIRKHFIHECGPSCKCYPTCKNQISQSGLKVRLEVFKTIDKGWGLRSWDAIRAGTFICEYAGEVFDNREGVEEDDYVFDSSCDIDYTNEWNYTPELLDEETRSDLNEAGKPPVSMVINAKNIGNVARFMNHGCSPNVFWQPVLFDHDDKSSPHIVFYALKHIPPMTELTYDYGRGGNVHRRRQCFCRSSKCRGYFH